MNPVLKYFNGEKAESFVFLIIGVIGIAISLYFIFSLRTTFWRALAIPFILVSMLEIIVGASLIYRSPKDILRVEKFIEKEPDKIRTDEIPRMNKVMRNFVIFRYTEIILILVGIILYFALAKYDFWRGLGIGLFTQASIILTLDFFAERRGIVYLEYLNSISGE